MASRSRAAFAVWMSLWVSLSTRTARADTPKLDAQLFHPSATSSPWIGLDSPQVLPHLRGAVGLFVSEGHDALQLRDASGVVANGTLIADQVWLEALGSVGFLDRLELGVALPVALYQGGDGSPGTGDAAADLRGERGAALGDLRLDLKILAVDKRFHAHRLTLAAIAAMTFPTSTTALAGEGNVTGRPRVALEWGSRRVHAVLNAGFIFRARSEALGLDVTNQFTWGVGIRANVWRGLDAIAEARGAVDITPPRGSSVQDIDAPVELNVALAWQTAIGLRPFVGGGIGIGRGYGAPRGRFLVGLRFVIPERTVEATWTERDDDHDGVLNAIDRCLEQPGPAANEGCPDTDFDGDGVIDRLDHCPERAGVVENQGCPDYDTDGDNIPDRLDRCPKEPGPMLGAGCPAKDSDHDGIPDATDRCPLTAGTAANDGCPDVDTDGDGLVDRLDKCPFEQEVYNGVADDDGCPDAGAALADLVPGQIAIFEPIVFEKDGIGEKIAARSLVVLSAVGVLLRAHTEIRRVRIDGHTDSRGNPVDNLDLSAERARMVRSVLVDRMNVAGDRLTTQGFGDTRPLVDNATAQDRARNRRIELTILDEPR